MRFRFQEGGEIRYGCRMGDKSPKATQKANSQKNKKSDSAKATKSAAAAAKVVPKTGKK